MKKPAKWKEEDEEYGKKIDLFRLRGDNAAT